MKSEKIGVIEELVFWGQKLSLKALCIISTEFLFGRGVIVGSSCSLSLESDQPLLLAKRIIGLMVNCQGWDHIGLIS